MDQLILHKQCDIRHFNEDDWTILGWQERAVRNGTGTQGEPSGKKDGSRADTVIGVAYVGVLVLFMLFYMS